MLSSFPSAVEGERGSVKPPRFPRDYIILWYVSGGEGLWNGALQPSFSEFQLDQNASLHPERLGAAFVLKRRHRNTRISKDGHHAIQDSTES